MSAAPLVQAVPITGRVGLCAVCLDAPATFRCDAITAGTYVYTFTCAYCVSRGETKARAMHAEAARRFA